MKSPQITNSRKSKHVKITRFTVYRTSRHINSSIYNYDVISITLYNVTPVIPSYSSDKLCGYVRALRTQQISGLFFQCVKTYLCHRGCLPSLMHRHTARGSPDTSRVYTRGKACTDHRGHPPSQTHIWKTTKNVWSVYDINSALTWLVIWKVNSYCC